MKKTVLAFCCVALGLTACQKTPDTPLTLADRLQAHPWRLSGLLYNGAPFGLDGCQLDDRQVYLDGTGYDDRGSEKCGENDPQRSQFSYTVLADGQTIAVTENGDTYHYLSVACDEAALQMTRVVQQDTLVISWQAE